MACYELPPGKAQAITSGRLSSAAGECMECRAKDGVGRSVGRHAKEHSEAWGRKKIDGMPPLLQALARVLPTGTAHRSTSTKMPPSPTSPVTRRARPAVRLPVVRSSRPRERQRPMTRYVSRATSRSRRCELTFRQFGSRLRRRGQQARVVSSSTWAT